MRNDEALSAEEKDGRWEGERVRGCEVGKALLPETRNPKPGTQS